MLIEEKKKTATAIVSLDGLAMVCFNPKRKRCETAILREKRHELSVIVKTVSGGEILNLTIIEKEDVLIKVTGGGSSLYKGYEKFLNNSSSMDRSQKPTDYSMGDFRWLVDIEDKTLVNGGVNLQNTFRENEIPLTECQIKNALFYTNEFIDEPYYISNNDIDKNDFDSLIALKDKAEQKYGYIGKSLGAIINSSFVKLKIETKQLSIAYLLPKMENDYYEIEIKNLPRETQTSDFEPDMPYYYRFISPKNSAETCFLFPETYIEQAKKNKELEKPVFGRVICHLVVLGETETFDGLLSKS
jgi:hypothetical protein